MIGNFLLLDRLIITRS